VTSLSGEWQLYMVGVALDVDATLDLEGAERLAAAVGELVPLTTGPVGGHWLVTLLASAPDADAAAWRTYERVHDLPGARLSAVMAGTPDLERPEVILAADSLADQR
jgi:hypothetical protein